MSALVLSERPTGVELADAIRAAARAAGVEPRRFIRPLTNQGASWIDNLSRSARPRPLTLVRVLALIAGDAEIPARRRRVRDTRGTASGVMSARPGLDPIPPTPTVDRDPCWRCGVRGDLGCEHLSAAEPFDRFAGRRA